MIELKYLTKEEQQSVSRNIEDFFIVSKKVRQFSSTFDELKNLFSKDLHQTLWLFITGSAKALRYNNTRFHLTLKISRYAEANRKTKQKHSVSKVKSVIDILEANGYITFYKGYYISDEDRMLSFVDMHLPFIKLFSIPMCKKFGMAREYDLIEMYKTEYTIKPNGRRKKVKTQLPTDGLYGIGKLKATLYSYNKLINISDIFINGLRVNNLIYKRVFEDTLFAHGRWYTLSDFQSHSKLERQPIIINGMQCVEIDLKSCQPSILYSWSGLEKPKGLDPYKIELSGDFTNSELRSLCKVALLCILFNDSRRAAASALVDHLESDKKKVDKQYASLYDIPKLVTKVLNGLQETNRAISEHFYSGGLWKRLQYADSSICEYVIKHFTAKGVPVISIHDSWVIGCKYKEELIEVMEAAWKHVVKDDGLNFGYSIEFDNSDKEK